MGSSIAEALSEVVERGTDVAGEIEDRRRRLVDLQQQRERDQLRLAEARAEIRHLTHSINDLIDGLEAREECARELYAELLDLARETPGAWSAARPHTVAAPSNNGLFDLGENQPASPEIDVPVPPVPDFATAAPALVEAGETPVESRGELELVQQEAAAAEEPPADEPEEEEPPAGELEEEEPPAGELEEEEPPAGELEEEEAPAGDLEEGGPEPEPAAAEEAADAAETIELRPPPPAPQPVESEPASDQEVADDSETIELRPPPPAQELAKTEPAIDPAVDRRGHTRRNLTVEVGMHGETNFWLGFSQDISEGGLFVSTYETLPVGTDLDLEFSLPGSTGTVHSRARVCWVREYREGQDLSNGILPGMGVRFEGLAEEDRQRIAEFVRTREALFVPGFEEV
jgi:uncharacterized protein (TIGR02266 family)